MAEIYVNELREIEALLNFLNSFTEQNKSIALANTDLIDVNGEVIGRVVQDELNWYFEPSFDEAPPTPTDTLIELINNELRQRIPMADYIADSLGNIQISRSVEGLGDESITVQLELDLRKSGA